MCAGGGAPELSLGQHSITTPPPHAGLAFSSKFLWRYCDSRCVLGVIGASSPPISCSINPFPPLVSENYEEMTPVSPARLSDYFKLKCTNQKDKLRMENSYFYLIATENRHIGKVKTKVEGDQDNSTVVVHFLNGFWKHS